MAQATGKLSQETESKGGSKRGGSDRSRSGGRERALAAALDLAVTLGWGRVSLSDIAMAAGLSLTELYEIFPTKTSVLVAFAQEIDRRILAEGGPDADELPRDRLFEVLMRRFDALGPHKAAVAAFMRDCADPSVFLIGVPALMRSMSWMLEAAGLSSAGLGGLLRVQGLTMIWINATRVWLRDDSADMARTMAALDKGLRRAESLVALVSERHPEPSDTVSG